MTQSQFLYECGVCSKLDYIKLNRMIQLQAASEVKLKVTQ
jgi:hypothetical protein